MQVMLSESSYEARFVHPVANPNKTMRQLRPDAVESDHLYLLMPVPADSMQHPL